MNTPAPRPVALVTGAARRIGRAIALELGRAGHDVVVHCNRSKAEAGGLVAELAELGARGVVVQADLTAAAQVDALADTAQGALGRVDVLVNNASVFHETPLAALARDALREEVARFAEVHVGAPLALIHALAPGMRERGHGAIVNLGDADLLRPGFAPYVASKAALEALTRALAVELAPDIRVNMVAPGAILPPAGAPEGEAERLGARVPLGRLGTPEEIAAAVRFFVAGPAFVTGQVLALDGGQHL